MKTNVTLSLDSEPVELMRLQGINISGTVNEFLEQYLQTQNKSSTSKELTKEIEQKQLEAERINKVVSILSVKVKKQLAKESVVVDKRAANMKVEEMILVEKYKLEEQDKVIEFVKNMTDKQKEEFKAGRKENKWGGMTDYARDKLKRK